MKQVLIFLNPRAFTVCAEASAKNDTFRIFYTKLYMLLSVDGSTNRRNEIIFGDIIIIKYGSYVTVHGSLGAAFDGTFIYSPKKTAR